MTACLIQIAVEDSDNELARKITTFAHICNATAWLYRCRN